MIRSLTLLNEGDASRFGDVARPPMAIELWLSSAPPAQVRGLLMATLRRWHELQDETGQ